MCVSISAGERKDEVQGNIRLLTTDEQVLALVLTPGATMCPVLPLLLLLAALNSESTASLPEDSTGLKFIVVFPENIAYYHPDQPQNKAQITALHDNTVFTITPYNTNSYSKTLSAGETHEVKLDAEQDQSKSIKTLKIVSTKKITVHAINQKNNSVQTALVMPIDKLGTEYFIPPVPKIQGTTDPLDMVTTDVTERSPFKLIIVSADKHSEVTVEGAGTNNVSLQPYEIAQIWVKNEEALRVVKANQPVAVLFGHTCAIRHNCTCGLLYAMLPPAKEEKLKFYIPPILAKDAEDQTFLLLSEKDSTIGKAFDPDSPLVESAGTVILYRPGLLLTLIPETDFAACSVINSIPNVQNFAVIVVHKDLTDGVRVKSRPLASPVWQELKGTEYVSTNVLLESGKNVIWHASSKMAVYFMGKTGNALFGNPAPIISKTPDFRGCALSPEIVKIGEVADGWRESVKYCRDKEMELVSFPNAQLQRHIYDKIIQAKNDTLQEVWIGMRRSAQTGEWYWLNKDPVNDTNWKEGEPGTVHDGQCAIMSLKSSEDFGWGDEDCCKAAHPVCYSRLVLLPM
ncbi:IgGFc-binding protein [Siniperca chuatsi]|uniref:IgGFc-binding protein n=1 Tax=Siniperca chuatsi TaxID=119488 RepID=UPI001CE1322D|nr:IgGFc-binding protein [Siniperca chuatsi]